MEWHNWFLWIISLLSFIMSLSKWLTDIKKAPKIEIEFNSDSPNDFVIKNGLNKYINIKEMAIIVNNKNNYYKIYPYENRDSDYFRVKSNIPSNSQIDMDKLYNYVKNKDLPIPFAFRIIAKTNTDKKIYSKIKIIHSIREKRYSYDEFTFKSFLSAKIKIWKEKKKK